MMQVKPVTFEYNGKTYAVKEREGDLWGCHECCFLEYTRDCGNVGGHCGHSGSAYITEAEEQEPKTEELTQVEIDDLVKSCLFNFRFGKMHDTMRKLDWKWYKQDAVPDISLLTQTAENLLRTAVASLLKSKEYLSYVATGGLRAEAYRYNDDMKPSIGVRLAFEIIDANENE